MIGRDRDVVDVLVTHGWFAEDGVPNGNDARVSRLEQHRCGLTGLYRNQRAGHHVLGEGWVGVVATFSMHRSRQTVCFTGDIPTELGQLTALAVLSLSDNQLTGECDHKTRLIASGRRGYHSLSHPLVCMVLRLHPKQSRPADCTHLPEVGQQ